MGKSPKPDSAGSPVFPDDSPFGKRHREELMNLLQKLAAEDAEMSIALRSLR